MADPQLISNAASSLVATLDATSATKNPFIYSYPKDLTNANIASHSTSFQVIQSNSTKQLNGENHFNIPKAGFLTKLWLKITLKNENGAAVECHPAIFPLLVSNIDLMTSGRVIYSQTDKSLLAYTSCQPYQSKKALEKAMNIKGSTSVHDVADNGVLTGYIPVLFYSFQNIAASLHTEFLENLQVSVKTLSSNLFCALADDTQKHLTLDKLELVGLYNRVNAEVENSIVQANYGGEGNLIIVNNDNVVETTTKTVASGADQSISHVISTNRVVSRMWVMIEDDDNTRSTYFAKKGNFLPIDSLEFNGSGQTIIPATVDAEMLQLLNQHSIDERGVALSNQWDNSSIKSTTNIYEISFSLSKDFKRASGGVSMREMSNPTIKANFTASSATSHKMTVVMLCHGLLSISSSSGRLVSALNS